MPKIDVANVPVRLGSGYAPSFDAPCATGIAKRTSSYSYLEVGSRQPLDLTTCCDIDMKSPNSDGRFVHKDGTLYSDA